MSPLSPARGAGAGTGAPVVAAPAETLHGGSGSRNDGRREDGDGDGMLLNVAAPPRSAVTGSDELSPSQPQRPSGASGPSRPKKKHHCRYYAARNGCRLGDKCPFIHDPSRLSTVVGEPQRDRAHNTAATSASSATTSAQTGGERSSSSSGITARSGEKPQSASRELPAAAAAVAAVSMDGRRYISAPVDPSRVVPRPTSHVGDTREFHLQQLRRRFNPAEKSGGTGTSMTFPMVPTDPDFPFDIDALDCMLHIPVDYPRARPSLKVLNKDIPRGYQINVERGFDDLARNAARATLLDLMNALDKNLETYLAAEKADTITFVPNAGNVTSPVHPPNTIQRGDASEVLAPASSLQEPNANVKAEPAEVFTSRQKEEAKAKREAEIRQLDARLGRLPLYSKSVDGSVITVPLDPRKRGELPVPLQTIQSTKLFVPELYNLEPCRIELLGVSREAASITEKAFARRAKENAETSLLAHINYLAQNMHVLATTDITDHEKPAAQPADPDIRPTAESSLASSGATHGATEDLDDRRHIVVIPRPREWVVRDNKDHDDEEESDYSSSESEEEVTDEGEQLAGQVSTSRPEQGTLISFPFIELHGIELLEIFSLSISVKCERCKTIMDISNLKDNVNRDASGSRSESCKKCANAFSIGFRKELVHANSVRGGYLDLDGCTIVDLLPSYFVPRCSECSTAYPTPGLVSVRGESCMASCRECYRKMVFKIPEVRFLRISSAAAVSRLHAPLTKKAKEQLGIVAGQQLPDRGRCTHYRKSYRWFRFSCCSKVFPCDRCHDEASDHPNEFANRMVCGYCSREQNYRPETCGICHSSLVLKRRTGYWEGGTGERSQARMSKKDPRKYKRRGKDKA